MSIASTPLALPHMPQLGCQHHHLVRARQVFAAETHGFVAASHLLDKNFVAAVAHLRACRGRIVVTGVGKSGLVGQKISATLASVGAASFFVHAAEIVHGDLGRISAEDVVIVLSNSGQTDEIVRLLGPLGALGVVLIAMTGAPQSSLGRHSHVVLSLGPAQEACPLGMVPTVSTAVMMVMGDALAMCLFDELGATAARYGRLHPGGTLGKKLMKVAEVMRRGPANPIVSQHMLLRQVIDIMSSTTGRPGAASVVGPDGKLVGFFTDGDLRRLLARSDFCVDVHIGCVMQQHPKVVTAQTLVAHAVNVLQQHSIDQLPVVGSNNAPVGLLDVQDVIGAGL